MICLCAARGARLAFHAAAAPRNTITGALKLRSRLLVGGDVAFKATTNPLLSPRTARMASSDAAAAPAAAAAGPNGAAAPAAASGDDRVARLRAAMATADGGRGVHAYVVPTEDPHMSEYPPDRFKRREFISGFTGSAGTAVVMADQALLWTDGRYFLQAEQELGPGWTLMRAGTGHCPEIPDYLAETLPPGARVGIDPFCHTVESVRALAAKLAAKGKELVPLLADGNLVDAAWGDEQPPLPAAPLRVHAAEWAGQSVADKLAALRAKIKAAGAAALLATGLDEVAWLTNTRGADVDFNPVYVGYALVLADGSGGAAAASGDAANGNGSNGGGGAAPPAAARLYVDASKVPPEAAAHLKAGGVEVRPYDALVDDVRALAAGGGAIAMDAARVSFAVYQAAAEAAAAGGGAAAAGAAGGPAASASPRGSRKRNAAGQAKGGAAAVAAAPAAAAALAAPSPAVVQLESPVVAAKAIKNAAELAGMAEAHLRDAVALCDFFAWLEDAIASGERAIDEAVIDDELTGRRRQQPGFIEPSFATIAGADANGAVIHYRAKPETARPVTRDTLLLLDSGGQYDCGTTDITRTLHLGTPTPHQKRAYTRVLQGHIGLDAVVFPEGTPGSAIDALARLPLWREGLNYRHGTGHGVGAALNVHEGPQSISTRYWVTTPLQAGMVCSNEPGYYEDGKFGVRIENLVVIDEAPTEFRFGGAPFLRFRRLTLVPIDTKLIEPSLLSGDEEKWLDDYHAEVWAAVSPRLADKPRALEWLKRSTRPLKEQVAARGGAGAAAAAAVAAV